MTVEIKNLKTGTIITEKFVTEVNITDGRINLKYDRRIRTTMVGKSVSMDMYAIESIIR